MPSKAKSGPARAGRAARDPARDSERSPWLDLGARGEKLPLNAFPSFLILRLAAAIQREVMPRYTRKFGVSLPEWRLLAQLAVAPRPMQFFELVARSTMDKALVSRALQKLVDNRLALAVANPEHGRQLLVSSTRAGKELYARVLPAARGEQAALLSNLTDDERIMFHAVLLKLLQGFEAEQKEQDAPPVRRARKTRKEQ